MILLGIIIITIGAIIAGVSPWPYKVIKEYKMEHSMFISQFVGIFIFPWLIFFCVCDVPMAMNLIGIKNIFCANIFSFIYGIGNIMCIICMVKIGFVMNSILAGVTALVVSTLSPFIFKGSGVFAKAPNLNSPSGIITMCAIIVLIGSLIIIAKAGEMRDDFLGKKGVGNENLTPFQSNCYKAMAIVAGLFTPGLLYLNTYYGAVLIEASKKAGCPTALASLSVWTIGMFGCIFFCCGYGLILMFRDKSFKRLLDPKDFVASAISGIQYVIYLIMYGFGSILVGPLGATIGNGISKCCSVGGQQFLGLFFGEWKGVEGKPVRMLQVGLILLFIGIILLSLSSALNK